MVVRGNPCSRWLCIAVGLLLALPVWARPQAERRIPGQKPSGMAAVQGLVRDNAGHALPGVAVLLRDAKTGASKQTTTNADGIFRFRDLEPGRYTLATNPTGFEAYQSMQFELRPGMVAPLAITLMPSPVAPGSQPPPWHGVGPSPAPSESEVGPWQELPRAEAIAAQGPEQNLPPSDRVFVPRSDRWNIPTTETNRHRALEKGPSRWNPFARNTLKGDKPVIGNNTFLDVTVISDSLLEARRLPVPSSVSQSKPGDNGFFGRGGQFFYPQNWTFSFDLFHGDTSYKPVDWRIRFTPVANINYLHTQENGIVNIDPRKGTNRFDGFVGIQELFGEYKIHDLSPNYDFISVRVGIQQFNSDFRGFMFFDEQPGVRFFGNLRSNRIQYNAAYFVLLDKDTNSLLNTLHLRHQQVAIANVYIQDFIWKGYTTEFSYHFNKDDPSIFYNTNDFLARPEPFGSVTPHRVEAQYVGWTSNGHIGPINVSHAFYQAFGHDSENEVAGRRVDINAQFAALELSKDKDWARFRVSGLFSSGDRNPRDGTARGFDTIVDQVDFAGGVFDLWNREAIRLTGTGVLLVNQDSFLPTMRSDKFLGQANFVNPGIMLVNVGTDLDLTPKLRAILNADYMRFHHTQSLEMLLFQRPIHAGIGQDYSLGLQYRPFLSDNVILTGGASVLSPFQGFRDIYGNRHLFSLFTNIRFVF